MKLRVIFIYHIISLFHLQMHKTCHGQNHFYHRSHKYSAAPSMHCFSQTTLQQLPKGTNEGCVISCVAKVPEDVTGLGPKTVTLLCEQSLH